MDQCVYCEAETELYNSGVPVCVKCSNNRTGKQKPQTSEYKVLNILQRDYQAATERGRAAIQEFDTVTLLLPNPDETDKIKAASREVSLARAELMRANARLDNFIERGNVPDDLKG